MDTVVGALIVLGCGCGLVILWRRWQRLNSQRRHEQLEKDFQLRTPQEQQDWRPTVYQPKQHRKPRK